MGSLWKKFLEHYRLTVYNGDLTGRVIAIDADEWKDTELQQVISDGEILLNISFSESFKKDLLKECFGSVHIVQETCYLACDKSGVVVTKDEYTSIGQNFSVRDLVKTVVNQQTGRYNSFITQFASGFQVTDLEMYKWLLYPILTSSNEKLEKGIKYRELREIIQSKHPEGKSLNPGNLTQALQACASLQVKKDVKPIILDYDQTNLRLNVVDRGFLIWLENQSKPELLELADLPTSYDYPEAQN